MLFNSYVFIFVFLPVVLAVHSFARRHPTRAWGVAWLVLASLVYYAWWRPEFVLLIVISVAVNFAFGKLLLRGRLTRPASRTVLAAGIAFNLGVLAYFKYAIFFVENVNALLGAGLPLPAVILPIGISFITFQKIAFLVDAHRGAVRDFSLPNFALFVTFFPQLIAGPIVHHAEVMPQFAAADERNRAEDLAVGLSIFCVGLFKKVVIADTCAIYADAGYDMLKAGHSIAAASAWVTVVAYALQLYYDFSGYSDMAVGLARMFGVRLPANFNSPYQATGIIDFWRRWHITLSRFLRDYLYVPLGGNRRGALRQYLNLAVVMLLGGLWHGANWTFVAWGALHGALLGLNHAWKKTRIAARPFWERTPGRFAAVFVTFTAVTLAWVLFRSDSLKDAGRMYAALFPFGADALPGWPGFRMLLKVQFLEFKNVFDIANWFRPRELWPAILPPDFIATARPAGLFLAAAAVATFCMPNTYQIFARFDPVTNLSPAGLQHRRSIAQLDWKVAAVLSAALVLSVLSLSRVSPFLYYQF